MKQTSYVGLHKMGEDSSFSHKSLLLTKLLGDDSGFCSVYPNSPAG